MPGIVVLLLAGHAAHAASYRIVSAVNACIDPKAALALGDAALVSQHSSAWQAATQRQGHCVVIRPGARWERILANGASMLLRRTPPLPGLPPLYFPAGNADLAADDRRVAAVDPGSLGAGGAPDRALPAAAPGPAAGNDSPITTEALPAPASATLPSTQSETPPMPAPQGDADTSLMDVTTNSANLERAMQQGYVIGFVAAMLLIALLLAVIAGIVWAILRNARLTREAGLSSFGTQAASGLMPVFALGANPGAPARRIVLTDDRSATEPAMRPPPPALFELQRPEPALPHLPPVPPPPPADAAEFRNLCIALLDAAGWQTSVRTVDSQAMPDVVAERDGRVLALQCLPVEPAVDEDAIDCTCMARERQQADQAAIVSDASFTPAAKRLALQTGIVLLHADELAAFAA
nr:restriction endonuclease [uncultured Lichenicoccus sp.]